MQGGAEKSTAQCSRSYTNNARAYSPLCLFPSLFSRHLCHPSLRGRERTPALAALKALFVGDFPEDPDMRTTGMCALLVCLCTVSPGHGSNASQDEYVEGLRENNGYERAAVHPPGFTAPSVNTDGSSSSLSLGKILSFFL